MGIVTSVDKGNMPRVTAGRQRHGGRGGVILKPVSGLSPTELRREEGGSEYLRLTSNNNSGGNNNNNN